MNMSHAAQAIKRFLLHNGTNYSAVRYKTDAYGKRTTETHLVYKLMGFYFESKRSGFLSTSIGDMGNIMASKVPIILCLYKDGSIVQQGDCIVVNKKLFRVTAINNVGELNVACILSLEVGEL